MSANLQSQITSTHVRCFCISGNILYMVSCKNRNVTQANIKEYGCNIRIQVLAKILIDTNNE